MTKKKTPAKTPATRRKRLAELEDIIERHLVGFMEVGQALLEIRDDKLYRETQPTFEAWAKTRFDISRRRAYELMAATEVNAELVRHGAQILPGNERQARELSRLPAEERPAVWASAIELAGGDDLTERHVRRAVREHHRLERVAKLGVISRGNKPLKGIKPHPVILADPGWQYDEGTTDPSRQIENKYLTMPLEEIMALEVPATDDCVLFLWVPAPLIFSHAAPVLDAWGFEYRSGMVWDKKRIGPGYWFRNRHEHLLLAVRGDPPKPPPSELRPSVIAATRGKHSAKPGVVHEMIEAYYPTLPRLEMFSRAARKGWTAWGNQA